MQNLRRGHYDIAVDALSTHRLRIAFDNLAVHRVGDPQARRDRTGAAPGRAGLG